MNDIKAVAICGQIGSGKSFISNQLASIYQWDIVSFSKYIKHVANSRSLPPTREVYQKLGNELYTALGPHIFLKNTLEFNKPSSVVHLYDSIRHLSIIEAIQDNYSARIVVFLDVTDEIRYARYSSRASREDKPLSLTSFLNMNRALSERGIKEIKLSADVIVDGSQSANTIIQNIQAVLW